MKLDPKEAPPGYEAVLRVETVSGFGALGCDENGGCSFLKECAARGTSRGMEVPGHPRFSCRPRLRMDGCRATFRRIAYGNEEED